MALDLEIKFSGKSAVLVLIILMIQTGVVNAQTVQEYYNNAVEAYENGEYESYLSNLMQANELRPNHRVIQFRLAAAYALNNQPEQAFEQLIHRINYYAVDDFSDDSLFRATLSEDQFKELNWHLNGMNKAVQKTTPAFSFERKGFHPEGIIYSDYLDAFLMSDARCGELLSFDPETDEQVLIADLKELGFWGGFGMAQDPFNPEHIWIASSAIFNYCEASEETQNKAAVLKIDLNSKEVLFSYVPDGAHVFGDLLVAKNGDVYVTDSVQPHIYKIDHGTGQVELWLEGEAYWNLQGLALHKNILIVSDYISGLWVVDLATKSYSPISDQNEILRGSDGIYVQDNTLFLLQNGARPMRAAKLYVDENAMMMEDSFEMLESGVEALNEPTLGTIYNGTFYFIYNSPWAYYNSDGVPDLDNWPALKVYKN